MTAMAEGEIAARDGTLIDPALACLALVAGYYRIAVDPLAMRRDLGLASRAAGVDEILRALHVISYWIAAFGMEPELLRLEPALETHASPFVTQNLELVAYLEAYPGSWRNGDAPTIDDKHLRVLLDQCLQSIERITCIPTPA